ncbi:hypothetical protein ACHAWF_005656 [Thalassiosira exigua]
MLRTLHLHALFAARSTAAPKITPRPTPRPMPMSAIARDGDPSSFRTNILSESWSTVSNEYERVLVPRFAPWTEDALDRLRSNVENDTKRSEDETEPSSKSRALVLCCGPGQELLPVAKITNGHVLGTDLAPGMIDVARRRIEAECNAKGNARYRELVSAEVADAMDPPAGPFDVIFSAFGLQQLPKPVEAVETWTDRLRPGGVCAFIYWPPVPPRKEGEQGPFGLWQRLVQKKLGRETKEEDAPWDENITAAVAAAGGEIVEDRLISHEMRWRDADEFFCGMSRAGPWHAMRLRRGDDFVDELGRELLSFYPRDTALCHEFTARMIVARSQRETSKSSKI